MSPNGTEPQPDPTLTIDLRCPNMILENTWNISDKHLFSRTLSHIPEGGVPMRHFSRNSWWLPGISRLSKPWYPINALSFLMRSKPRNQLAVWARLKRARQECLTRKAGLTHWGRVTHKCVSKLTIIGSDNGLSPGWRQAIIWINAGILLIRTSGTNFSEILSEIRAFSLKKMHLKMSTAKWRPFCLGLNVLTIFNTT